ncbi:MAG: hypothetical protein FWD28_10405, partial [Treponema sp.]|nr:hypothetical protein [Treponema sp.]
GKGILVDFIKKHSSEIHSMLYGEYRIEDEIAVVKRETWEECSKVKDNETAKKLLAKDNETAKRLLEKGSSHEFVNEITGLDLETIKGLSSAS